MNNYFRYLLATFIVFCLATIGHSAPKELFDAYFEKRQRDIDNRLRREHFGYKGDNQ